MKNVSVGLFCPLTKNRCLEDCAFLIEEQNDFTLENEYICSIVKIAEVMIKGEFGIISLER